MMKLVQNLESVLDAIRCLNVELESHSALADRLGLAHAFYVLERDGEGPLFGFSKFVGYEKLSAEQYLNNYGKLDGRNTENALRPWFDEVRPSTPEYARLYSELEAWLNQYGKRPRGGKAQKVRIMVVRPELREARRGTTEDRRLLELMLAVADLLPVRQRHELRAAL
ncbi:hypothetical protein GGQ88_003945 [Novosphingobium hassiacum]|uniref:Uncharacterized protein n=1 Tax=Novosphingobium hassiacum TaxID=173676 RepID=A0A7W5ZZ03_9SPHN|nr:hypothetical protein [Novosphingobium hassiacum]MBB3862643.1 hypothetical protein [Novosphingobium hassiacum]